MGKIRLDREEADLLDSYEAGEWRTAEDDLIRELVRLDDLNEYDKTEASTLFQKMGLNGVLTLYFLYVVLKCFGLAGLKETRLLEEQIY